MSKPQQFEDETIDEGFSRVSSRYTSDEDKSVIDANRRIYDEASNISELLEGSSGERLIEWLNTQITNCIMLLLDTRESRYLSDLKSLYDLKMKLTNAKTIKETIRSWLESH